MLSSFPDREAGPLKIRGGERSNRYCNQVGTLRRLPENGAPAFWAEMECHDSTAVRLTRIPFVSALNEPNLLSREPCLNSECASRPALAFKAMAHGDTNGVALAYQPKLSTAARGFVVCHSSYPFVLETSDPSSDGHDVSATQSAYPSSRKSVGRPTDQNRETENRRRTRLGGDLDTIQMYDYLWMCANFWHEAIRLKRRPWRCPPPPKLTVGWVLPRRRLIRADDLMYQLCERKPHVQAPR
jgi:hypothetical protein